LPRTDFFARWLFVFNVATDGVDGLTECIFSDRSFRVHELDNALQVRFLDFDFRCAFFEATGIEINWKHLVERFKRRWPDQTYNVAVVFGDPHFEDISDVWFSVKAQIAKAGDQDPCREKFNLAIEIKPSMGDDYPAVLRQIKRQKAAASDEGHDWDFKYHLRWFLLVDHFASNVVTLDQVRQIFRQDEISIVLMSDIRERLVQRQQRRSDDL
jgi:hypothetical protein